jgi:hypothetical protein
VASASAFRCRTAWLQPSQADSSRVADGSQYRRAADHRRNCPACVRVASPVGADLQAVPQTACPASTTWSCA